MSAKSMISDRIYMMFNNSISSPHAKKKNVLLVFHIQNLHAFCELSILLVCRKM